jgi:hypothetical protein
LRRVAIAPNVEMGIPSGSKLGYTLTATQLITAHFRGRSQVFEAYVSVSPSKIFIIGLDPLGSRVVTITATEGGISSELSRTVPSFFRPENMLADFVIVYWPASEIRRGLAGTDASLHEDLKERRIDMAGRAIVRVTYDSPHQDVWPELAHLENFVCDYRLDVESKVIGR